MDELDLLDLRRLLNKSLLFVEEKLLNVLLSNVHNSGRHCLLLLSKILVLRDLSSQILVTLNEVSLSIIDEAWLTLHKSTETLILAEWLIILSDETVLGRSTEELLADLLGLCAHKLHLKYEIFILRGLYYYIRRNRRFLINKNFIIWHYLTNQFV